MIKVEHVTKYYGDFKALDDISFEIGEGQVVGFLGPNGAGKTTTLKLLTCNAYPHSGRVTIAGFDVVEEPQEVQARIGYLPESAPLYKDMLVWEYLDFMGEARGMSARERKDAIMRVAEQTGISDRLGQLIGELSKGYRQRVGLAQAIMHEPDVLILDEPYTGLDPLQIIEIRNLIKEYGKSHTVFLSSHILQEVEATADRVIIINAGRIVSDGEVAKLLGHDTLVAHVEGPREPVITDLQSDPLITVMGDSVTDHGVLVRISVGDHDREEVSARVFEIVKDQGWKLLRLETGRMTFEDLFISLTKQSVTQQSDGHAKDTQESEEPDDVQSGSEVQGQESASEEPESADTESQDNAQDDKE